MSIDWAGVATIFLAIVLATLVENAFLSPKVKTQGATAVVGSEGQGVELTGNPITDYLRSKYPNADGVK